MLSVSNGKNTCQNFAWQVLALSMYEKRESLAGRNFIGEGVSSLAGDYIDKQQQQQSMDWLSRKKISCCEAANH